jgi:hypothetical protein
MKTFHVRIGCYSRGIFLHGEADIDMTEPAGIERPVEPVIEPHRREGRTAGGTA